jgi:hypothetical protein
MKKKHCRSVTGLFNVEAQPVRGDSQRGASLTGRTRRRDRTATRKASLACASDAE